MREIVEVIGVLTMQDPSGCLWTYINCMIASLGTWLKMRCHPSMEFRNEIFQRRARTGQTILLRE